MQVGAYLRVHVDAYSPFTPSHFKGRTYGEGETSCHVIHTRMESVFNGRTGIWVFGPSDMNRES